MGSSELIFRGHEPQQESDSYTPKSPKPWESLTRLLRYLLREQRLIFLLIGIAVPSLIFIMSAGSTPLYQSSLLNSANDPSRAESSHRMAYQKRVSVMGAGNMGGKIPLGLKRKGLRIVVTGGAGFVGSHLVDRLMKRGDSVIVVDNFFTGNKENVMHHFGKPNFELIRHDVVEPLLLEVDQIYHLACPASPVHYKFNPVKTIISSFFNSFIFFTFIICFIPKIVAISNLMFQLSLIV